MCVDSRKESPPTFLASMLPTELSPQCMFLGILKTDWSFPVEDFGSMLDIQPLPLYLNIISLPILWIFHDLKIKCP